MSIEQNDLQGEPGFDALLRYVYDETDEEETENIQMQMKENENLRLTVEGIQHIKEAFGFKNIEEDKKWYDKKEQEGLKRVLEIIEDTKEEGTEHESSEIGQLEVEALQETLVNYVYGKLEDETRLRVEQAIKTDEMVSDCVGGIKKIKNRENLNTKEEFDKYVDALKRDSLEDFSYAMNFDNDLLIRYVFNEATDTEKAQVEKAISDSRALRRMANGIDVIRDVNEIKSADEYHRHEEEFEEAFSKKNAHLSEALATEEAKRKSESEK